MYKFRALVQFSYGNTMFNPRRETYQLSDDVVQEWERAGYVKIVDQKVKKDKKAKEE